MKLDSHQVAEKLEEMAMLLELSGANPFKIRAFQNGARTLEGLTQDLNQLISEKRLTEIKGIGEGLSKQIESIAKSGTSAELKELRKKFPESLLEILQVPGLGPKKAKVLYEKLGIESLGELEYACQENRLLKLEGFGEKTQEKIIAGIAYLKGNIGKFLYADAIDVAEALAGEMKKWKEVKQLSIAGSLRRCKEIVRDVDLLCSSHEPKKVMDRFVSMKGVKEMIAHGDTKSSVRWENGLQFDLRVVTDMEFPYALHHFTGSKEHNTAMRTRAKEMGLKMNEYGLFRGEKLVRCKSEEEIFRALHLSYIPPEMRENQGEIEEAEKREIPTLLNLSDLCGFFHVHSTYSDGRNTLEEMVSAASKLGLKYIGISDHSQTASYAHGLKEADLIRQKKEIDRLQKKFLKLRLFWGIESDILPDGSLDYPDRILKNFDFVIGSVHAKFKMTEEEMTKRCLRAMENPSFTILGHPTGRLLLTREGFQINLTAMIDAAAKHRKIVELNANPHRLDLDWRILGYAKKKGVPVAINPDAHSIEGLSHIRYGVNIARKAGLTPKDVYNALTLSQMEKSLAH